MLCPKRISRHENRLCYLLYRCIIMRCHVLILLKKIVVHPVMIIFSRIIKVKLKRKGVYAIIKKKWRSRACRM